MEKVRINAFLAKMGLGSRRKVEELVTSGRIQINGNLVVDLSFQTKPGDIVLLDGNPIEPSDNPNQFVLLAFHKPRGYLTSHHDVHHEKTIFDLLPPAYKNLYFAGRLDLLSRGLLLLTNQGDLVQKLTHPSHEVEKEYLVSFARPIPVEKVSERFVLGVREGGDTLSAVSVREVTPKNHPTPVLSIVLQEGKKRQIRRMCKTERLPLVDLFRVRIGGLDLRQIEIPEGTFLPVQLSDILDPKDKRYPTK